MGPKKGGGNEKVLSAKERKDDDKKAKEVGLERISTACTTPVLTLNVTDVEMSNQLSKT